MHKIIYAVRTPNGSAAIIENMDTNVKLLAVCGRIIEFPNIFGHIKRKCIYMLQKNNKLYVFHKKIVICKYFKPDFDIYGIPTNNIELKDGVVIHNGISYDILREINIELEKIK